jgi:hypothetical protein
MSIIYKNSNDRVHVDIAGPQGTAIELLGQAALWMTQMNKTPQQMGEVIKDMTSGNYETMVQVFDREFGHFCDILR